MSNFSNDLNLFTFVFNKNEINKESLVEIFNIDNDFSENEDFFRDDTLELGYANESERCSEEIYNKHKKIKDPIKRLEKMVADIPGYSTDEATFIIGNSNFSGDYDYDITVIGDNIILSLAYIG